MKIIKKKRNNFMAVKAKRLVISIGNDVLE